MCLVQAVNDLCARNAKVVSGSVQTCLFWFRDGIFSAGCNETVSMFALSCIQELLVSQKSRINLPLTEKTSRREEPTRKSSRTREGGRNHGSNGGFNRDDKRTYIMQVRSKPALESCP